MKWIEPTVFAKSCGNPDFRSIFGHQRAKNEGTKTKIDRGPETYPISINPWDEMNRADSFHEKLRKPCLQTDRQTDGRTDGWTDGRTDGQTSGWIQYTPFPPSVERGYKYQWYNHNKTKQNWVGILLSHWPLGDLNMILKMYSSISLYWLVSSNLLMIMSSDECHRALLMISQHWFG